MAWGGVFAACVCVVLGGSWCLRWQARRFRSIYLHSVRACMLPLPACQSAHMLRSPTPLPLLLCVGGAWGQRRAAADHSRRLAAQRISGSSTQQRCSFGSSYRWRCPWEQRCSFVHVATQTTGRAGVLLLFQAGGELLQFRAVPVAMLGVPLDSFDLPGCPTVPLTDGRHQPACGSSWCTAGIRVHAAGVADGRDCSCSFGT